MTACRAAALAGAAACAIGAATIVTAPADAAPGWTSAPVSETGALGVTGLGFAPDGSGVLTFEAYEPGHRPNPKLTGLALRPPAGAWTRGPDVPGVTWGLARVHAVGSRTAMVGMHAYRFGAYNRARWQVVTATGRLDGAFGRVHGLARPVSWVGSAAGGRGELLAAWLPRDDSGLRVERLLPARGPARTLSPPGAARPLLVAGPRGHVLAASTRGRRIEARMRAPGGRWGPIRPIAPAGPAPEALHGAVGADGRAILAWGSVKLPGRWRFRTATTRSGTRWATHRLESFTRASFAAPASALPIFDAAGNGRVAWAGVAGVKVARADGTGVQLLPVAAPVAVDDIARSRLGELAIVFSALTPGQGPGPGPFVASAPPGGAFGAPVDVGAAGTAPLQGAKLAFDPLSGRPAVAWVALEGGAGRAWISDRG